MMKIRTAILSSGLMLSAFVTMQQSAMAQGGVPGMRTVGEEITRSLIWLGIAGIIFLLAYKVVDWTTPGDLKKQLAEGNTALAIYVGSLVIAIAIIIGHLLG
jgi:uncharacterized membrane protein YjfL (UPF0719 family)